MNNDIVLLLHRDDSQKNNKHQLELSQESADAGSIERDKFIIRNNFA